jgi:hypothetical protein
MNSPVPLYVIIADESFDAGMMEWSERARLDGLNPCQRVSLCLNAEALSELQGIGYDHALDILMAAL